MLCMLLVSEHLGHGRACLPAAQVVMSVFTYVYWWVTIKSGKPVELQKSAPTGTGWRQLGRLRE